MVRIRVSDEGLRQIRWLVDDAVINSALQIVQDMFGCLPVSVSLLTVMLLPFLPSSGQADCRSSSTGPT